MPDMTSCISVVCMLLYIIHMNMKVDIAPSTLPPSRAENSLACWASWFVPQKKARFGPERLHTGFFPLSYSVRASFSPETMH